MRGLFTTLLTLTVLMFQAHAAELHLVLVVNSASPVASLTRDEVRKLYLGVPIVAGGHVLKPLRNNTDPLLREVFMQQVMFMATPAYERQIMSRVYRFGEMPPPVYTEKSDLVNAIQRDHDAVTYMFRDEASGVPRIRIISELWHGEN